MAEREEAYKVLRDIMALVLKRREIVKRIGRIKRSINLPIEDFEREKEMRIRLVQEGLPLDDEFLGLLFNLLIKDSLTQQGWKEPKEVRATAPIRMDDDRLCIRLKESLFLQKKEVDLNVLAERIGSRLGLELKPHNILPTYGRRLSIFLILYALCRGKSVTIPLPSPAMYGKLSWFAGARPIRVDEEKGYGDHMLVSSPNDPTGKVYELDELDRLTGGLSGRLILDASYFDLHYTDKPPLPADAIITYGLSTPFGLPFPHIIIADREMIKKLKELQVSLVGDVEPLCTLAWQMVNSSDLLEKVRERVRGHRDKAIRFLKDLPLRFEPPEGGIFLFIKDESGVQDPAGELSKRGVAVTPGPFFDAPKSYFRLNFGIENLDEGLKRLADFYSSLRHP
jgi:histidinol-phosphate/aromatic aminotransferase/cobyric acid decarboxylase-like protein/chorismate mutase